MHGGHSVPQVTAAQSDTPPARSVSCAPAGKLSRVRHICPPLIGPSSTPRPRLVRPCPGPAGLLDRSRATACLQAAQPARACRGCLPAGFSRPSCGSRHRRTLAGLLVGSERCAQRQSTPQPLNSSPQTAGRTRSPKKLRRQSASALAAQSQARARAGRAGASSLSPAATPSASGCAEPVRAASDTVCAAGC